MSKRVRGLALIALALCATLMLACSDSDDTSATPDATTPPEATGTPTDIDTGTPDATAEPDDDEEHNHGTTAPGFEGGPSTEFELSGLIDQPATFTLADLEALPASEVTANAQTRDGEMGEHTYTGPLLHDLIEAAEPIVDEDRNNDLLRRAVVVTGSDGYQAAIAWGEIDPNFAGKQILVAYERDGEPLPEESGFVRLVVPDDVFGGRYVSNIISIEVVDGLPPQAEGEREASTSLELTGLVDDPGEFDRDALEALPQTDVTAQSGGEEVVFTGVLIRDLLDSAGLQIDPDGHNEILRIGIVGVGSDGYAITLTGGEVSERFGNIDAIVATAVDGEPLSDDHGFARIVVPGDERAGRNASNLVRIEVVNLGE